MTVACRSQSSYACSVLCPFMWPKPRRGLRLLQELLLIGIHKGSPVVIVIVAWPKCSHTSVEIRVDLAQNQAGIVRSSAPIAPTTWSSSSGALKHYWVCYTVKQSIILPRIRPEALFIFVSRGIHGNKARPQPTMDCKLVIWTISWYPLKRQNDKSVLWRTAWVDRSLPVTR